jgi:hypothetical protein
MHIYGARYQFSYLILIKDVSLLSIIAFHPGWASADRMI